MSVNISSVTESDGQSGLDLAANVPFCTIGPVKRIILFLIIIMDFLVITILAS